LQKNVIQSFIWLESRPELYPKKWAGKPKHSIYLKYSLLHWITHAMLLV